MTSRSGNALGASDLVIVEYRTHNFQGAIQISTGSSFASNLEQVPNLLYAQASSAA